MSVDLFFLLFIIVSSIHQIISFPLSKAVSFTQLRRVIRQQQGWNRDSPTNQPQNAADDSFIFEDDFEVRNSVLSTRQIPTTARPLVVPGMGTPRSACENRCQTTPEYNPVCGDNNITYFSMNRLRCAQNCGKRVNVKYAGACPRF